jgi:hypothetical protein
MLQVGFEPTIAVSERAKKIHALDGVTTVIGVGRSYECTNVIGVLSILKIESPSFEVQNIGSQPAQVYGVCTLLSISSEVQHFGTRMTASLPEYNDYIIYS